MMQELFNRAATCLKGQLPFVLYRKPNKNELIGVFQKNDEVHKIKDFTEKGFVFAPFDLNSGAILLKMDSIQKELVTIEDNMVVKDINSIPLDVIEKARYLDLIANALDKINDRVINKVVLSREIEVDFNDDYNETFKRLLKEYPKAFCYFWHHPEIGTWMGATPEILVKSNGSQFTTMSLAGTQNSIDSKEPQWSKKEINEQQLVTDYIVEALKDKVVSIRSLERESIKAGQLWHLRTEMKGTFSPNQFGDVLKALHPTPAVCGSPLQKAKEFILNNELYDRSFYTGFLGELNVKSELSRNRNRRNQENSAYRSVTNTSELFVNLRCMQLQKDKVSIYVGGGITSDSVPESEWDETTLKSNTMLRILNSN
ncbi:hypothetical protein LCGC14_0199260 [marine sediment metagenome]|uniref:Chorismate-utilising enzyme C-terminal domain-containing protein n=1 Tax=marine sediment metagenome TaxID=412755 RepID=A0A0F9X3C7_9ZZZZ|nr:chorismate-binding protein [Maribacter sp.]HDZ03900.1 isochorismate synthase [Maribacter sp.]